MREYKRNLGMIIGAVVSDVVSTLGIKHGWSSGVVRGLTLIINLIAMEVTGLNGALSSSTNGQIAVIAVIGGIASYLQGGKFGHGFISAGISTRMGASDGIKRFMKAAGPIKKLITQVTIGGTVSRIGGGKFANGVGSAAFAAVIMEIGSARAENESGGSSATRYSDEEAEFTYEERKQLGNQLDAEIGDLKAFQTAVNNGDQAARGIAKKWFGDRFSDDNLSTSIDKLVSLIDDFPLDFRKMRPGHTNIPLNSRAAELGGTIYVTPAVSANSNYTLLHELAHTGNFHHYGYDQYSGGLSRESYIQYRATNILRNPYTFQFATREYSNSR